MRQRARVVSTFSIPRQGSRQSGHRAGSIAGGREQTYEQQMVSRRAVVARRAQPLQAGDRSARRRESSIATRRPSAFAPSKFDAQKGFFLNGKPVKVKGTCNHQDHAGPGRGAARRGAVLPRAQAAGDGLQRAAHLAQSAHAGTAECLRRAGHAGVRRDAHDVVESRGLSQFENLVRRDRNHPSVFMWSMGNEEGQATPKGLHI
jgi:beta-galactosidase